MGRTDDVINVAGHRLSTGSMEEVLAGHPAVAECAVIGVADALKGQVPRGFVVLKAGVRPTPEALRGGAGALVRDEIGAVAALRAVDVVARAAQDPVRQDPARSMRAIADGVDAAGPVHHRGPGRAGRAAPHPHRPTGFAMIRQGLPGHSRAAPPPASSHRRVEAAGQRVARVRCDGPSVFTLISVTPSAAIAASAAATRARPTPRRCRDRSTAIRWISAAVGKYRSSTRAAAASPPSYASRVGSRPAASTSSTIDDRSGTTPAAAQQRSTASASRPTHSRLEAVTAAGWRAVGLRPVVPAGAAELLDQQHQQRDPAGHEAELDEQVERSVHRRSPLRAGTSNSSHTARRQARVLTGLSAWSTVRPPAP